MILTWMEKILVAVAIVLFIGLSYLYLENASLKKHYIEKRDSLYVSTQNVAALKDQNKMKADSIQNYAVAVNNLQNDQTLLQKKYILLKNEYATAKKEWEQHGGGQLVVTPVKSDTIKIPFNGSKGKIQYDGFTRYFNSTGKYEWFMHLIQLPSVYKSELSIDESGKDKTIKNLMSVDGELIANATTVMDDKLFLMLRNNAPVNTPEPNFWDKAFIGATIEFDSDSIQNLKTLSTYSMGLSAMIGYNTGPYQFYLAKSVLTPSFGAGLQYTITFRTLGNSIFGIK